MFVGQNSWGRQGVCWVVKTAGVGPGREVCLSVKQLV